MERFAALQLVIARLGDATELEPKVVADKIGEREPSLVVRMRKSTSQAVGDDPYADYKIPDDLVWQGGSGLRPTG